MVWLQGEEKQSWRRKEWNKRGGAGVPFFILRDLDCCNSGFGDAAFSTSEPMGEKGESTREQGMDGLQERECEQG